MFGKIKNKVTEKVMENQLKNLPEGQREMVMNMIKENPDFFKKMSEEIETAVKGGKSQMAASMEVMRKYQGDLQKMMMKK